LNAHPNKSGRGRRRLLAFTLSGMLALLGAEVLLRVVAPQELSGTWRVETPSGLLVNKSSGSTRHQVGSRVARYTFHPPHLRETAIDPDRRRVLCVGDSFTFGWLLDGEDTTIAHLQSRVGSQVQLLNAAAAGWGLMEQVAYVEEFGADIDPAAVLVFVNYHDIDRALRRRAYTFAGEDSLELVRHDLPRSRLKSAVNALPGYGWLLEHSHFVQGARRAFLAPPARESTPPPALAPERIAAIHSDGVRLGQALFARLEAWCDGHGAQLWVTTSGFVLPEAAPGQLWATRAFLDQAEGFFTERGIPYLDVSAELLGGGRDVPTSLLIPGDGHPNERGAARVAELVYERFLGQRLR
jgi:hypothetical protein